MVKTKRQQWRKIDLSNVEEARDIASLHAKVDEKKASELYTLHDSAVIKKPSTIKKIRDAIPNQALAQKNNIPKRTLTSKKVPKKNSTYDLWETNDDKTVRPAIAAPIQTKLVPAVKIPQPVESYNPSSTDYQAAIEDIINKEKTKQDEEKEKAFYNKPLTRELLNHYPRDLVNRMDINHKIKALQLLQKGELLNEIKANEQDDKELLSDDDIDNDDNEQDIHLIRQAKKKKKTKTQRNKERRLTKEVVEAKKLKHERKFEKSFKQIDQFIALSKKMEKQVAAKTLRKNNKNIELITLMKKGIVPKKRFGKSTFEEAELELPLPSELTSSLRCMKVKGNAASERINSIYRRQLLEAPPTLNMAYNSKIRYLQYQKKKSRKTNLPPTVSVLKPLKKFKN